MHSLLRLLIVEDNPADVCLIRESIAHHMPEADISVVEDGEAALRTMHLDAEPPNCPDLLLLDLNLPRRTGEEVLRALRSRCRDTAVMVLTSSQAARDRDAVQSLGVDYYFVKPSSYDEYMKLGEIAKGIWQRRQAACTG